MATPTKGKPDTKTPQEWQENTRELLQKLRSTKDPVAAYKISKKIKHGPNGQEGSD